MIVICFLKNLIIMLCFICLSCFDFKVEGIFNVGVVDCGSEIIMLLCVVESVFSDDLNEVKVLVMEQQGDCCVLMFCFFYWDDFVYDFLDLCIVVLCVDFSSLFLIFMLYICVVRSCNGLDFEVEDWLFIYLSYCYELYGCEDFCVILIEGCYYINYFLIFDFGIVILLVVMQDFEIVVKLGLMFLFDNCDVCFFLEKVGGYYWVLYCLVLVYFGWLGIWIVCLLDMLYWGDYCSVLDVFELGWDQCKVGGGVFMFRIEKGWLQIYYGVDQVQCYCFGVLLFDFDDLICIVVCLDMLLMELVVFYEVEGFFGKVVFICGVILCGEMLYIYYGGVDEVMVEVLLLLFVLWCQFGV